MNDSGNSNLRKRLWKWLNNNLFWYLAQLSILDTELKLTPAKTAFFSRSFLFIKMSVAKGTFGLVNVMYLYFSLPIKQYLNCWRNEIFFSVWVWAILWPDLMVSREDLLSLTLPLKHKMAKIVSAAPSFLLIPFHVHINLMPRFSSGSIKACSLSKPSFWTEMMVYLKKWLILSNKMTKILSWTKMMRLWYD